MGMELLLTGMCQGCTCGDFTISNETIYSFSFNQQQRLCGKNIVKCSHREACERIREKTYRDSRKEVGEILNESIDYLIDYGQHDKQFKLGETIKYSPTETRDILREYWEIKEDR